MHFKAAILDFFFQKLFNISLVDYIASKDSMKESIT